MKLRLNCPRCATSLKTETIKGHIFEYCYRCGGSFLEKGIEHKILGEPSSSDYWKGTEICERKSGELILCPQGHESLITYAVGFEQSLVEVDVCSSCHGLWLDKAEGTKLFNIVLNAGQAKSATFNEKPGFKSYLFQAFSGMPVEAWNPVHRRPIVTIFLMLALSFVFVLQHVYPALVEIFVLHSDQFFSGENTFSLISYGFLHSSLAHLLGNLYFLYIFGDNVEDYFGRVRFSLIYLAAIIVSGLVFVVYRAGSEAGVVGASGAIAAMMGAYIVLFPKVKLYFTILFVPVRLSVFWYLLFWLIFNVIMMLTGATGVAWSAHIGGFIFGAAAGYFFRLKSIKDYIESR